MNISLQELANFLQKKWYERQGLILAMVFATVVAETLLVQSDARWWIHLVVVITLVALIAFVWWLSVRPPRTPKDRVGFLVSIRCSNDAESKKVREDFLVPLQKLISSGSSGQTFHYMQLPPHLADRVITHEHAQAIRIKAKAHFLLYGDVRLRPLEGSQHYIIELDGIVSHKTIPKDANAALSREFAELLPRRINIPAENDLLSFRFTSEWTEVVTKYIVGIASAVSGDLDYAESLFRDTQVALNSKDRSFPIYSKVLRRLPIRISEINLARANMELSRWEINHEQECIERLSKYLALVDLPNSFAAVNLRAICMFIESRDAAGAIKALKTFSSHASGLWHCNMAFLNGYKGSLKSASRHYNQAAMLGVEQSAIGKIEEFICWVLENEPERVQLHYCLGIFNFKIKGDIDQAAKDFMAFVNAGCESAFSKEVDIAKKWLQDHSAQALSRSDVA